MPMSAYDNWLAYLDRLTDSRRTESERAMQLYLDAVSIALSEVDFLPRDKRTTLDLIERIGYRLRQRVQDFADIPNMGVMLGMHEAMMNQAVIYQHRRLMQEGRAAPECVLATPCGYHPGGVSGNCGRRACVRRVAVQEGGVRVGRVTLLGLGFGEQMRRLDGELMVDDVVYWVKFRTHRCVRQRYNWFRLGHERIRWMEAPVGDAGYAGAGEGSEGVATKLIRY